MIDLERIYNTFDPDAECPECGHSDINFDCPECQLFALDQARQMGQETEMALYLIQYMHQNWKPA